MRSERNTLVPRRKGPVVLASPTNIDSGSPQIDDELLNFQDQLNSVDEYSPDKDSSPAPRRSSGDRKRFSSGLKEEESNLLGEELESQFGLPKKSYSPANIPLIGMGKDLDLQTNLFELLEPEVKKVEEEEEVNFYEVFEEERNDDSDNENQNQQGGDNENDDKYSYEEYKPDSDDEEQKERDLTQISQMESVNGDKTPNMSFAREANGTLQAVPGTVNVKRKKKHANRKKLKKGKTFVRGGKKFLKNNKVVPITKEGQGDVTTPRVIYKKTTCRSKLLSLLGLNKYFGGDTNILDQQDQFGDNSKKYKKKLKAIMAQNQKMLAKKEKEIELDKIKRNYLSRRQKINKAINMRKLVRYLWLLFFYVIFGVIIGGALIYLVEENNFISYSNANLSFELDKCTLLISDHADADIQSSVYAKYEVPRKVKLKDFSSVDVNLASDPQKITVNNPFELEYCLMQLFVKSGTSLGSLAISCTNCHIIQDTSFQLQITGTLNITGDTVHANFRNIQVGLFVYDAITGYLQLNNIDSTSTSNKIEITSQGDIIIQSTQDFKVDATTDTQAFCFNGPSVQKVSSANCAISGDSTTYSYLSNTGCQVVYDICSSASCTASRPKYTVNSIQGNVYANLIPSVSQPVASGNTPAYGRTYDSGISLNPVAQGTIDGLKSSVNQNSKSSPFAILHLGDIESQSSRYTKWIVASNPSYGLMRPWWIATFGATVLNGDTIEGKGLLLPGYCPFIPEYTTDNLLEVQQLLIKKTGIDSALITFVHDQEMSLPPASRSISTGIFHYVNSWSSFDRWYSLYKATSGDIFVENNDFTDKSIILGAILVSFIIAAIISFHTMRLVIYAINSMYYKLIDFANHLDTYSKLEQSKVQRSLENKKTKKTKKTSNDIRKYTLSNLIKHSPSPSAFIDYLMLIIYRQFSNSVKQYYYLLFKEVDALEIDDQELDPGRDIIRGTEAKVLYEKFCFINHLTENKLTTQSNILLLRKYGFEIVTREDLPSEVFINIEIKNYDNFLVNPTKEGENLSSLEQYVRENVVMTEFEEDQVEVDTFIKLYNKFCDYNRLPRVIISPSLMKDVFNINMMTVPQQFIMRKAQDEDDFRRRSLLSRIFCCFRRRNPLNRKTYIIDTSRLENHFKLVMNKITDFATDEELDDATIDLILYPGWGIWDGFTVLFHILQGAFLVIPIIALVVLNESAYTPWSMKDPDVLISLLDMIRDPYHFVGNLYSCSFWNITMMILVTILWVVSFLDLLLYYWGMEFPQDKSFKTSLDQGEVIFRKIGRKLEWILVLMFLTMYFGYVSLLLIWLMFGALINPDTFLPFATAAITFATFVWTKYSYFKELATKGEEAVMGYLKKLFGGFTNKVLNRLADSLENTQGEALSEGKSFLQSKAFKDTTNSLVEKGLVDAKTIAEYTQRIESLDSKTIGVDGNVALNDPIYVIREMESIVNSLKDKIVEKVKEECEKREIPSSLVEIIIAVAMKDSSRIKNAVKYVVTQCGEKNNMPKGSVEVIIELLFSQCINKEEKVKFITNKIIEITFNVLMLNTIKGLTPEIFILMFDNFSNLQEMNLDSFVNGLKDLLVKTKENSISEIKPLIPVLDIISVLGEGRTDYWKLKQPSLNLLYSILTSSPASKNKQKEIKELAKFLLLISSNYEMPSDLETNQPLEAQDMNNIINNFCISIGLTEEFCEEHGGVDYDIISSLIHFSIAYARHETVDLTKDVIKDLEGLLNLRNLGKNEFVPFCMELTNNIFVYQAKFYRQINECCHNFGLNRHLQNFIKVLTCYSSDDYETHYSQIKIDQNPYFLKIADTLKISPNEMLGLFDLIYHKYSNKNIYVFLKAVLIRMGLKKDKLRYLRHLINLFLSNDEAILLQATKALHLDYTEFLLVGKGVLNPRFVETEKFKSVGIDTNDLIKEKATVYNFPEEHYSYWKYKLRRKIEDNLGTNAIDPTVIQKEKDITDDVKSKAKGDLVRMYLEDWNTQTLSRKNIIDYICILDNKENRLKKDFLPQEKGSLNSGVDFLTTILSLKNLQLVNKERHNLFDKEKDNAVNILAECLSVNAKSLKKFIQMLVLGDVNEVLKCFLHFFPEEKENEIVIKKVISYTFKQVNILGGQINFLTKQLPQKIEFIPNKHLNLPGGLFSKIFYNSAKVTLSISDILELGSLLINKYEGGKGTNSESNDVQETLLRRCYVIGKLAKGILPVKKIEQEFGISDKKIIQIFKILTQPEEFIRLRLLGQLFKERYHPLKVMVALHGLFCNHEFKIRTPKNIHAKFKKADRYEEESIKSYLANLLNVYPEALGLFEIAFERNVSKFIQKALPIMRRVNNSSFIDVNMMESLLSLSVGEHFNTTYIGNKLDISSDVISFFMSLSRLAYSPNKKDNLQIRRKELNDLAESVSAKKVLAKLKIKPLELIALLRLVLNIFESDVSVAEAIGDLGLKKNLNTETEKTITIDVDLLKGLIALDKSFDPKANLFENSKVLKNLKVKTTSFFNLVGLGTNIENAYIISRLVAGNFLVLLEYSQKLDWAFPYKDPVAGPVIRSLTMALCALVNSTPKVTDDMNKDVNSYVDGFNFDDLKGFAEDQIEFSPGDKLLPNNTLAYAIYLAYQTLDIAPIWMQVFFFDKEAFEAISDKLPKVSKEFILVLILNIIYMPDIFGDLWGLFEWNLKCKEFCEKEDPNGKYLSWDEYYKTTKIYEALGRLLRDKMTFDYQRIVELAKLSGIGERKYWRKLLKMKDYNKKINESLLYILTYTQTQEEMEEKARRAEKYLKKHPLNFLVKFTQGFPDHEWSFNSDLLNDTKSPSSGDIIRTILIESYKCINGAFILEGQKKPGVGYELTNFCMLGTIVNLKNCSKLKMSYERILYNLHQLTANVERKLYFEPYFVKMSKFKLMKLVGASIGVQISNIIEWCLPPSLFSPDYVAKLVKAKDSVADQKAIMVEQCRQVVLNYDNNKTLLGDLGKLGGTYDNYKSHISRLVKADDWDSTTLLLSLSEVYLGNPEEDRDAALEKLEDQKFGDEKDLLLKCCFNAPDNIYLSKEMVSQIHKKESSFGVKSKLSKEQVREEMKKEEEKLKEAYEDVKTGLNYKTAEKRSLAFEAAMMDSDVMLFMGVTIGDMSVLFRGDHIISGGEDGKKKAKIYKALFGLQSFRKAYKKDRKQLKEYLTAIAPVAQMESDISKLEEIIMFILTGKVSVNEMLNALEINDHNDNVLDLLFMSLKEQMNEEDDDDEDDKVNPVEVIKKALKIPENDLKTFDLIRNIYQFNREAGWLRLVDELSKDTDSKTKKGSDMLKKLIKMLDFEKLRNEAGDSKYQDIPSFIRSKAKNVGDVFTTIFKEAILCQPDLFPKKQIEDQKFLLMAYEIIQNLIYGNLSKLFEFIVLTPKAIKPHKKSRLGLRYTESGEELVFDMLLRLFDIPINGKDPKINEDIKLLKIFLTIGNGDLTTFKDNPNYQSVIQNIVNDFAKSKTLLGEGIDEYEKSQLSELLVGALIWDIELIIKAFMTQKTIEEAYLLYNIYGCVFLNNLLSFGNKYADQAQTHLKVLLSTVAKKVMSPAAASAFFAKEENTFGGIMKKEFANTHPSQILTVLEEKFNNLLKLVNKFTGVRQPKSLFHHICKTLDDLNSKDLYLGNHLKSMNNTGRPATTNGPLEQSEESYELAFQVMASFCDGSMVARLLNTVIKDQPLKELLSKLIRFILKIIEKLLNPMGPRIFNNEVVKEKMSHEEVLQYFQSFVYCLQNFQKDAIWSETLKMAPYSMQIYLTPQANNNIELEKSKIEVINVVKTLLMEHMKDNKQQDLLLDLVSVVLGLNMKNFDKSGVSSSLKFDLTSKERMELFFVRVLPVIFPGLVTILYGKQFEFNEKDFEQIYDLITRLRTEYMQNLRNPQKMREIVKDLSKPLERYAGCKRIIIISMIKLIEGDLSGFKDSAMELLSNGQKDSELSYLEKKVDGMATYLDNVKEVLNFDFANKLLEPFDGKTANLNNNRISPENWNAILKKIKNGTATTKDLFEVLDLLGNGDGAIDEKEFTALACRLGLRLSQHRVKEIFAKVKGTEAKPGTEHDLNDKEFEEALGYLESKNLIQALQLLHITPEQLTVFFFWLVTLLIFIFIFIFLGIKAFAVGGTFGSIVNSLFPAAGGAALGKNKDADKEQLDEKNVENASDTAFNITVFEEL